MSYKGTTKYKNYFKRGQKIGKWTVVSGDVELQREAMIECICECGVKKLVSAYTLKVGTSTSCKKCQRYDGNNNGNWKGVGVVPGYYLNRRNISISAKKEAARLIESQNFKCALTGLPISFIDKSASLDRIDSNKGYIVGNMQWVHKDVNIMKNAYDVNYFIKLCKLIVENNSEVI